MSDMPEDRKNAARKKAQDHLTSSQQRDALVKQERDKELASVANKTAKLRALRLAKETAEKEAAALAPPAKSGKKAAPARRKV